jgi:hypothetical protein
MSSEKGSGEQGGPGVSGEEEKARGFIRDKKTDESWKEKARQEKEKLAGGPRPGAAPTGPDYDLPPASFGGLLEDLSVRALFALGQMADPATGEVGLDLVAAKYAIDLLGVLEEKTRGNLSRAEESSLKTLLQRLRFAFVEISRSAMAAGAGPPPDAPPAPGARGGGGPPAGGRAGADKPGPKIIF